MSQNDGVLGDDSLSMGVVTLSKRQSSQVEHLDLAGSSIVTIENAGQHYVTAPSSVSQENLNLENVLVTNSRMNQHLNNTNGTPLHHSVGPNNPNSYNTIEYVSSPVVALQDHQNKFTEGLVPVSNVDFVEMNEAGIKGAQGTPLELYFDVMPTTSSNSTQVPQTTTSFLPRPEHQTPKAQLLVRAYSDFIQSQEQQQQQQQTQQQQLGVHVHPNEQAESATDHPEAILPDVLGANFAQLDQTVISQNLNEYRKTLKLEPQKRQIHMQVQPKQIQSFPGDALDEHENSHNQKLLLTEQTQPHQESMHNQQLVQAQNMKDQAFPALPHQPRYQLIHKQFTQTQRQINLTEYVLKEEMAHPNIMVEYTPHHDKTLESTSSSSLNKQSLENETPSKTNSSKTEHAHHMPMVSRSGRPIRRRPEYIEYVNQNMKEEQMQYNRNMPLIKTEGNGLNSFEDDDDEFVDDDENDVISNDEDHDQSGVYSSDGKKSLPHKKRIPKKLKNTKKHVKCYKCSHCGEQFINQSNFTQHKQTHHSPSTNKPKQFSCEICAKACDSQLKFFEHLKSHYEPFKKHKCEVCGGEFGSGELLQEHSSVHSREHFKCNVCHKTFRKESMLEVHIKVAHLEEEECNSIEKPYTCTVCPKSYRSQLALDTHVQSEHSDNPPEFNCEDCYRVFKSKAKLVSHRKVEHKEETVHTRGPPKKKLRIGKSLKGGYACTVCPRTFTHKNSLIYHIRGHTGERPHQCEHCGKAFFAASALKVHLRLHSGEKPYKCNDCGKFFRQWGDLRYHTSSVHSEARQFQCEFCGKDFKRKYCLVVHRRIHTGEKKYKCDYCQKSFRASSYLQNHKRIHTGERPYPCPDCGKPFRVRSDMKRHRNTHLREVGAASNSSPSGTTTTTTTTTTQFTSSATSSSQNSNHPTALVSSQAHTVIARQSNHPHQSQVQILQGPVTSNQLGQLIIADSVPAMVSDQNQPIRIMVSGLSQQSINHGIQPPPAHRHSQVTAVSVSSTMAPSSPTGTTAHLTTSSSGVGPEVILMDESNNQPINLNILPRMIAHGTAAPQHNAGVAEEEEYQLIPATRTSLDMREEGDVCVWSGVHVFTG